MKRVMVWLILVAMLLTGAPLASAAVAYTTDDVMTAVDGMGRMPANYYNIAGIGLSIIDNVSSAQAEKFTKKLYTIWAFLSKYAYTYNKNMAIKDVLTREQMHSVTRYMTDILVDYGTPEMIQVFYDFLNSVKTSTLIKSAVPKSLLGIQFGSATYGQTATVKVYTTADVADGGVSITNASGQSITASSVTSSYVGTLATFKEHILTVNYPYSGKVAVRVTGVDAAYPANYYSATVKVSGTNAGGSTAANKNAVVTKLTASSAILGTASTIRVTTSYLTSNVKITDSKGTFLVGSSTPNEVVANVSKTFELSYSFEKAGTQSIRAYAGTASGEAVTWNKTYKTGRVSVTDPAAKATISKVSAPSVYRGQEATVSVFASADVSRVQFFDASGNIVGFTRDYTTSGKYRVFTLKYTKNVVATDKISAQAGNDIAWNAAKKSVTVKFLAPTATVKSTRVKRGKIATITVTPSPTVTAVRLYKSDKTTLISPVTPGGYAYQVTQATKGTMTVYVSIYDGIGWSDLVKSSVTFT